jgi:hypothetical protein
VEGLSLYTKSIAYLATLEKSIFNYHIEAQHIWLAQLIGESVGIAIPLSYQRLGKYGPALNSF